LLSCKFANLIQLVGNIVFSILSLISCYNYITFI
jgi:hypothetical protein